MSPVQAFYSKLPMTDVSVSELDQLRELCKDMSKLLADVLYHEIRVNTDYYKRGMELVGKYEALTK